MHLANSSLQQVTDQISSLAYSTLTTYHAKKVFTPHLIDTGGQQYINAISWLLLSSRDAACDLKIYIIISF